MSISDTDLDLDKLLQSRKVPDAPVDLSSRIIAAALADKEVSDDLDIAVVSEPSPEELFAYKSPQFLIFSVIVIICGCLVGLEVQTLSVFNELIPEGFSDFDMLSEEWI